MRPLPGKEVGMRLEGLTDDRGCRVGRWLQRKSSNVVTQWTLLSVVSCAQRDETDERKTKPCCQGVTFDTPLPPCLRQHITWHPLRDRIVAFSTVIFFSNPSLLKTPLFAPIRIFPKPPLPDNSHFSPQMNHPEVSTSEAAEVVLKERQRQRALQTTQSSSNHPTSTSPQQPALETVSTPQWKNPQAHEIDESELDRRQRVISERLEKRQREVQRQGKQLARVRAELKALEQPIKQEIMQLRERLEDSNRRERDLVDSVNALRKDLFEKEKGLEQVRQEKQQFADDLIRVMADYERRKTERLNEIADIVGEQPIETKSTKHPNFAGF
eukprot:GFKZ01007255.1.p2 GENE.GFKZ01007255.1~~GFKZ01007255.1.p2  ORF type:complete len:327 (+),score=45.34 GFKZ01007255.1:2301-3281(+)